MQVVVDIMGADPMGLREQCEAWCIEHMPSQVDDAEATAGTLLRGFLRSIDDRTKGADALSVSIVRG